MEWSESVTVSLPPKSPARPSLFSGYGAETSCLSGKDGQVFRQEAVVLLKHLHGLMQVLFLIGQQKTERVYLSGRDELFIIPQQNLQEAVYSQPPYLIL